MNAFSIPFKKNVKRFVLIWAYFVTLLLVLQLSLVLGSFLNQEIDSRWTVCASSSEHLRELIDSVPSSNSEISMETIEIEGCSGTALELTVRYQGNLITYLQNEDEFQVSLMERNVRILSKSMRNTPILGAGAAYGFGVGLTVSLGFLIYQRRKQVFIDRATSTAPLYVLGIWTAACVLGMVALVWLPFQIFLENIKVPNYLILDTEDLEFDAFAWVFFVLLAPVTEEVLFRAWLLDAWRRVVSPAIALLLSSVVFSVVHPMGVTANLIFVIPGLLLGALWLKTRSLAACIVAHSAYNAFVLFSLTLSK